MEQVSKEVNKIWVFSTDFLKAPLSNFTKIRPVGAALIYADRRVDMTKLIGAFHYFTKAPKNLSLPHLSFVFTSDTNEFRFVCNFNCEMNERLSSPY